MDPPPRVVWVFDFDLGLTAGLSSRAARSLRSGDRGRFFVVEEEEVADAEEEAGADVEGFEDFGCEC